MAIFWKVSSTNIVHSKSSSTLRFQNVHMATRRATRWQSARQSFPNFSPMLIWHGTSRGELTFLECLLFKNVFFLECLLFYNVYFFRMSTFLECLCAMGRGPPGDSSIFFKSEPAARIVKSHYHRADLLKMCTCHGSWSTRWQSASTRRECVICHTRIWWKFSKSQLYGHCT